jgi:hypothetical protein
VKLDHIDNETGLAALDRMPLGYKTYRSHGDADAGTSSLD